jgi:L-rhamnose mutarotase
LKIKKGYIYLAIIFVAIYLYFNYKDREKKIHYSKIIDSILTDIRREDYFALHSKLSSDLKSKISIDDIKNYCTKLKISKDNKFEIKDYKESNNTIKISGIFVNSAKKSELHTTIKEQNGTITIISQKIGKISLVPKKESFPILSTKTASKAAN